jgi:hypothetical protein
MKEFIEITSEEQVEEAKKYDDKLVIEVYTPTCMKCRMVKKALSENSAMEGITLMSVNASEDIGGKFVYKHNISGVPTLIMINGTEEKTCYVDGIPEALSQIKEFMGV